jgi:hypothetical protein
MLDASSPLTRWIQSQSIEALDWIGEVFLEPAASSRFQIESEVFTNVPPSR